MYCSAFPVFYYISSALYYLLLHIFFMFLFVKPVSEINWTKMPYNGIHLEWLQSWSKYWRQALVFMWNSLPSEKFNFYFSLLFFFLFYFVFASIDKIFILAGRLGYFLSLETFGKSWGNSYIPCLLLIITLRFTCGERKIS